MPLRPGRKVFRVRTICSKYRASQSPKQRHGKRPRACRKLRRSSAIVKLCRPALGCLLVPRSAGEGLTEAADRLDDGGAVEEGDEKV